MIARTHLERDGVGCANEAVQPGVELLPVSKREHKRLATVPRAVHKLTGGTIVRMALARALLFQRFDLRAQLRRSCIDLGVSPGVSPGASPVAIPMD